MNMSRGETMMTDKLLFSKWRGFYRNINRSKLLNFWIVWHNFTFFHKNMTLGNSEMGSVISKTCSIKLTHGNYLIYISFTFVELANCGLYISQFFVYLFKLQILSGKGNFNPSSSFYELFILILRVLQLRLFFFLRFSSNLIIVFFNLPFSVLEFFNFFELLIHSPCRVS